jgi:hypothetical protein
MIRRSGQKILNGWFKTILSAILLCLLLSENAHALQLHAQGGGIITHQIGHLFFLFSMIVLIFTIRDKYPDYHSGWQKIQYACFFFILWNLDALAAHFLDNQINVVSMIPISINEMVISTQTDSALLAWVYYILKLDHLLCVPAMIFLYLGLSEMVKETQAKRGAEK